MTGPLNMDQLERQREEALEQWRIGDSDLVYDFVRDDVVLLMARIEELEAEGQALIQAGEGWMERLTAIEAGVAALTAAARAAVTGAITGPYHRCRVCSDMDQHAEDCPVGALAALLEDA